MASGHEGELAWDLADQYRECFSDEDRVTVYMHLGAGDYLAAIRCILDACAQREVLLAADSVVRLEDWIRVYDRDHGFRAALARARRELPGA